MFRTSLIFVVVVSSFCGLGRGSEFEFERPPIDYDHATPTDRVAHLRDQIEAGQVILEWDAKFGWLPSLLDKLKLPRASQTLVFSKTSLQLRKISPATPRALYFNDDVYVGWVQQGDKLEVAAVDRQLGAVFYNVPQRQGQPPRFLRDQGECLSCHATPRTQNVPGFLVRSVFPSGEGQPLLTLGSTTTDHRTPFPERFGGWYVTGTHGQMRHRGNAIAQENGNPPLNMEDGANCVELAHRFDVSSYLEKHSDIVALMVLEHQSQMHNAITQASYVARQAGHYDLIMNRALERDESFRSDSTLRRIQSASENLVEHLLFAGEPLLQDSVQGTTDFAAIFSDGGIKDSQGRSLKELDLRKRLFRFPCSFLIYSEAFSALPLPVLEHVRLRLIEILSGRDGSEKFRHLSTQDRQDVHDILRDTLPSLLSTAEAP
ncbi:MAG: hypothetical protein O2931_11705 [Planctomycetota bacterium]|nr:hypothetical protein [Planctomycetota bacterium]MDA1179451.1 hypothetical protein [Planctomycetota bacterium]